MRYGKYREITDEKQHKKIFKGKKNIAELRVRN